MAPTRRTNQDTSRIQEENNTHLSCAGGPPLTGSRPTINLTPEDLAKIVSDAVEAALEEERREEERESSSGSKSPTVAEELEELRKKVRVLEGQVVSKSSAQVVKGYPFSDIIVREPLLGHFKSAKIKDYDGSSDPEEHLARFENMAMLHCYGDQIKCKFSSSKKYKKTAFSLFKVKQGQDETLRAYIKRFNRVALDVPAYAPETKTTAFMQWLWEGDFFRSLKKKLPGNFEDILSRAEKYINIEDAQNKKIEALKRAKGDRVVRPEERVHKKCGSGQFSHVPLRIARDREIQECSSAMAPCPSSMAQLPRPEKKGFCTLHKKCSHDINECRTLKKESHRRPAPTPRTYSEPRQPSWLSRRPGPNAPRRTADIPSGSGREKGRSQEKRNKQPEQKDPSPIRGVIKMISGGSTDGDSNRARKSRSMRDCMEVEGMRNEAVISFGPEDLKGVNLPHNDALVIQARVDNYDVMWVFIDSGSSVNVIFKEALIQMDLQGYHLEAVETALYGFSGHVVYPEREIVLPLTLGSQDLRKTVMTSFIEVDSPLSYNIILGRPAINELRAVASTYHQKIKFPVGAQVGEVRGDQPSSRKCYVEAVRADQSKTRREEKKATVEVGGGVVEKGEVHFVADEKQEIVEVEPGKHIRVARDLEVFTRVAEHKLNILPRSRPVKQKKRHFGPEKDKVIDEQVGELLRAGHIREVQFPIWLSNVVLVPKATGKWRMCVEFRDLNKASPKDCYPLHRIDQLVDSTSGFELLSFMDAYQGYHQIPLAREDQDKASFITSGGIFCYVVMPFGLKNAGATYQRLMNHVFQKQIGRNIEVYVDDILIKTREVSYFVDDLAETFATLKQYGIKLNPAKCVFGVKVGNSWVSCSVLIREERTDQKQVYYVSHALRGAELNYSKVEKIAMALVVTARKLRPYFLSHPIVVLTNYPLGRIMTHAEVSGRMVKWTIELREYNIEYKPRVAIKAQALTDFLIEMIQPREEEVWRVFVDGASNSSGCGVGVVLVAPSGEKIKLALRIDSRVTNNEAEYEAVLAGLQAAREVGASRVIIYSDSQLVAQQIKGTYEAKNEKILKYLGLITAQAASLTDWSIEKIPREENGEADTLAKLAASMSDMSTRKVLCFTRLVLSVDEEMPENKVEYVLREIHKGCCGEHLGGTALSRKAILAGFWWPWMNQDSAQLVQKCKDCQHHSNFHHRPVASMQPISASCPFDQWGLDIVGPFPIARAQKKFLLVAVDYFSKWVEAEPLAKINEEEVMKFLWKNIVCRFGIPRRLISDNGRQFQGKKITSWCQEMKITQSFTSVAYPQANGQTEVTNRIIVQAVKARLHGKCKDWVEELPSILWAYRTTPRTVTRETPYSLVYGSEAVLPVEVGQSSTRIEYSPSNIDQTPDN
ncbi:uncharacterized protein LOC142529496 [Primulina tabacum]|uniref:uncharacterized protein LOC142529496 n=1 Tax=Primulina tabacum TaxID=48773 RepID=UPI003F5AC5E0